MPFSRVTNIYQYPQTSMNVSILTMFSLASLSPWREITVVLRILKRRPLLLKFTLSDNAKVILHNVICLIYHRRCIILIIIHMLNHGNWYLHTFVFSQKNCLFSLLPPKWLVFQSDCTVVAELCFILKLK